MDNQTLAKYVAERLGAGVRAEELRQHLIMVGWSEEDAGAAIVKGLIDSGVPAPSRVQTGGGRLASTVEVILSVFSFILLGGVASALLVLLYQIVNRYFPDPLALGYGYSGVSTSAIHYSIAALIVGYPIYVFAVKSWFKRYREDEAKVESKLTKWLTYIVLLVAAVTIVGDLVTTLFYFLQGELSARFVLKALSVLAVFGSIFGFYFLERRRVQYRADIPKRTFDAFMYVFSAFVLVSIAIGFAAGGSPGTERKRGFDSTRSSDLSSLSSCIESYSYDKKTLPASLETLAESTQYSYCSGKTDPETGAPYEYRVVTPSVKTGNVTEGRYELCATFSLMADQSTVARDAYSSYNSTNKWYLHEAGRSCDTGTVTLDRGDTVFLPASPVAAPIK